MKTQLKYNINIFRYKIDSVKYINKFLKIYAVSIDIPILYMISLLFVIMPQVLVFLDSQT